MADSRKRRLPRKAAKQVKERTKKVANVLKNNAKELRTNIVRRAGSPPVKDPEPTRRRDKEPDSPWRGTNPDPWGGGKDAAPWGGKQPPSPWGGKDAPSPWGGKDAPSPWGGKDVPSPWGKVPGPWRPADVYVYGESVTVVLDRRTAENLYYALALALSGVNWPEAAGRWARMGKAPTGYGKGRSPKDAEPKAPWAR